MKHLRTCMLLLVCGLAMTPALTSAAFRDLPADHYAHAFVDELVYLGVFKGYPDNTFRPDLTLSRAEGVALAMRIAHMRGTQLPMSGVQLADVPSDAWYAEDASLAVAAGFITGMPKDGQMMFSPGAPMTRGDMIRMLVRAAGLTNTGAPSVFADVPDASAYYPEVMAAYEAGIVEGYLQTSGARTFGPQDSLTRAQFAKMAFKALQTRRQVPAAIPHTGTGATATPPNAEGHSDRFGTFMAPFCGHEALKITCSYSVTPFKFLKTLPFADPEVKLVEGFALYDGNLKDEIGTPHKGIDYTLVKDGKEVPFAVYAMSDGYAYQGVSGSWGNYVMVSYPSLVDNDYQYLVVYSHLDSIPASIPATEPEDFAGWEQLPVIKAGTFLGMTGTSGMTNDIPQLHLEVQMFDTWTWQRLKVDPYGLFNRWTSQKYPQPGESLQGYTHFWMSDVVPLAKAFQ